MEDKNIKITFQYPQDDEERSDVVTYTFDKENKILTVSVSDGQFIVIDDLKDLEDVNIKISAILSDDINELDMILVLMQDFIITSFLSGSNQVNELNDSRLKFNYEDDNPMLLLNNGKVIDFSGSTSDYYKLTMKDLLK